MYGLRSTGGASGRDITYGDVKGVWYKEIGGVEIWDDDDAPVGFFDNRLKKESPNHE